ncbi:MAG: pilin [Defluviitaleaceae bacterium]|nr:pilin [Defluviitaleaceae bacterium]
MFDSMNFLLTTGPALDEVTAPIIDLLITIFNVAIPVVGAIGAIFCIFLGLKLAKADEQQDREKAKSSLKNAIIGFVLIFVLVVALRIGLPILTDWATETTAPAAETTMQMISQFLA